MATGMLRITSPLEQEIGNSLERQHSSDLVLVVEREIALTQVESSDILLTMRAKLKLDSTLILSST